MTLRCGSLKQPSLFIERDLSHTDSYIPNELHIKNNELEWDQA